MSSAIFERIPTPYLALNAELARQFDVVEGQILQIDLDGYTLQLPARILDSLPDGVVGLPFGLPTIPAVPNDWGKVSPSAVEGDQE
jgi:NADH-quinone oxidoreductase subunit G